MSRIKQYGRQWNGENYERMDMPPDVWFGNPDPNVTRNFIMSYTADDLMFYGRAFCVITSRKADGFPNAFTWIPAADVTTWDQAGPQWWGPSNQIYFPVTIGVAGIPSVAVKCVEIGKNIGGESVLLGCI